MVVLLVLSKNKVSSLLSQQYIFKGAAGGCHSPVTMCAVVETQSADMVPYSVLPVDTDLTQLTVSSL